MGIAKGVIITLGGKRPNVAVVMAQDEAYRLYIALCRQNNDREWYFSLRSGILPIRHLCVPPCAV